MILLDMKETAKVLEASGLVLIGSVGEAPEVNVGQMVQVCPVCDQTLGPLPRHTTEGK